MSARSFRQTLVVLLMAGCQVGAEPEPNGSVQNEPAARDPKRPSAAVVCPSDADFAERLAAREIRRYVYLRTGTLLRIVQTLPKQGNAILLAREPQLDDQSYSLRTATRTQQKVLTISGST